jgi:hypothetical protein
MAKRKIEIIIKDTRRGLWYEERENTGPAMCFCA